MDQTSKESTKTLKFMTACLLIHLFVVLKEKVLSVQTLEGKNMLTCISKIECVKLVIFVLLYYQFVLLVIINNILCQNLNENEILDTFLLCKYCLIILHFGAGALKGHISIITGHIFTKLAWMKHIMIHMRLTRLNYESEPYVLI